MRIVASLVFSLILVSSSIAETNAMETGAVYRMNAYLKDATQLVFQPQSSSPVEMKIKKGEVKAFYIKTVLDLNIRVLSPCVESCDVEVLKINDIVSPSALPEALAKKPDLISKPGSLDKK